MLINKRNLLASLGCFFGVMLLVFIFDSYDQINQIVDDSERLSSIDEKIKLDQNLINEIKQLAPQYNLLLNKFNQNNKFNINLTSTLFYLFSAARANGVDIKMLKSERTKLFLGKKITLINMSAVGGWFELTTFFDEWIHLGLPLAVNNFDLYHYVNDTWRMTFELTAYAHDEGATKISEQYFQAAHLSAQQWLMQFPLAELHNVGFLEQAGLEWVLLKLPNEKILPVQVGSVIGSEKKLIIAIKEHKIVVSKQDLSR